MKENEEKCLTKGRESGRIVKLSQRTTATDKDIRSKGVEKFFKKVLKNLLTSVKYCDIIVERSHEGVELNLDN